MPQFVHERGIDTHIACGRLLLKHCRSVTNVTNREGTAYGKCDRPCNAVHFLYNNIVRKTVNANRTRYHLPNRSAYPRTVYAVFDRHKGLNTFCTQSIGVMRAPPAFSTGHLNNNNLTSDRVTVNNGVTHGCGGYHEATIHHSAPAFTSVPSATHDK
jgi:hypothetical protein